MRGRQIGLLGLALILATIAATSGCAFSPRAARQAATGVSVQRVNIDAKNWLFVPSRVWVKVGLPVELVVTSLDVDHGIEFVDLDVPVERVPAGRSVTIRFIPNRTGQYTFRCAVVCGTGHELMKGILIVE